MARLTIGQKASRTLYFLMGLRNPHIAARLAAFGFDQASLDEGWALLRGVAGERLASTRPNAEVHALIGRIDGWENRWFPIAAAVLKRHHPDTYARVFHNLPQTDGPQVVLSVTAFLDRIDQLAADPAGAAALATLAQHGLTTQVLAEIRSLIGEATSVSATPIVSTDLSEREQAMWDFYLQWSAIARAVITDRRQLRMLGFLKPRRNAQADEAEDPATDLEADGDDLDPDTIDPASPETTEGIA